VKVATKAEALDINACFHCVTFHVYATSATPSSTTGRPPFSCPAFAWAKGVASVGIEMSTFTCTSSGDGGGGSVEGRVGDASTTIGG